MPFGIDVVYSSKRSENKEVYDMFTGSGCPSTESPRIYFMLLSIGVPGTISKYAFHSPILQTAPLEYVSAVAVAPISFECDPYVAATQFRIDVVTLSERYHLH